MALEFLDLLSADHHAMDDDFYRRLGYRPTSLNEGLVALVDWLRELRRID